MIISWTTFAFVFHSTYLPNTSYIIYVSKIVSENYTSVFSSRSLEVNVKSFFKNTICGKVTTIFDYSKFFIKSFWRRVPGMSLPIIKSCLIQMHSFFFTILWWYLEGNKLTWLNKLTWNKLKLVRRLYQIGIKVQN